MSVIAGTALIGGGGGAQGVRVQACPASGGSCTVDPYPVDEFGFFHFLVPNGTYTITIFAPVGSPDGPKIIGPLVLPPSALHLSATFGAPGSLPEGVAFNGQEHVIPSVFWGNPSTMTVKGCKEGFGAALISGINTSTGQGETRTAPFSETPYGSGAYLAQFAPLVPIHGTATINHGLVCPDTKHMFPSGGTGAGGTPVLLGGAGFTGARAVTFGSTPAISFKVLQDNVIEAISPPGTGNVPIAVTKADGTTIQIASFSYFGVTAVSTTSGPSEGGTEVAIHGYGFSDVKSVAFGIMPATSYKVVELVRGRCGRTARRGNRGRPSGQ